MLPLAQSQLVHQHLHKKTQTYKDCVQQYLINIYTHVSLCEIVMWLGIVHTQINLKFRPRQDRYTIFHGTASLSIQVHIRASLHTIPTRIHFCPNGISNHLTSYIDFNTRVDSSDFRIFCNILYCVYV